MDTLWDKPLTKLQELQVAKLLDANREWAEWQQYQDYIAKRTEAIDDLLKAKALSKEDFAFLACPVCDYQAKNHWALNGHMYKHKRKVKSEL